MEERNERGKEVGRSGKEEKEIKRGREGGKAEKMAGKSVTVSSVLRRCL